MHSHLEFEVVVVGGGMVGATLACSLARGGINVALLDTQKPPTEWLPDTIDLRVSALTLASQKILDTLGVWSPMADLGVSPFRSMRVWDSIYQGELFFDSADVGEESLGYIVENRVTVAALWQMLESLVDASVLDPARVVGLQQTTDAIILKLSDDRSIKAGLVVAADGRDSTIRSLVGIEVNGWSYGQDALVTTVKPTYSHKETAYQWFLTEGPLAFLPLKNGECSIVWTSASRSTKKNIALSEDDFLTELEKASGGMLGKIKSAGKRVSFPIGLQFARAYTNNRVVLVGDAAHTIHPFAGQGANMGLLDAAALTELMLNARFQGRSISSRQILRRYERWRKGDNLAMLGGMDSLKRVFGVSFEPFGRLRSLGMNLINDSAILKNFLNKYAMGVRGDLPKLAYGRSCWH